MEAQAWMTSGGASRRQPFGIVFEIPLVAMYQDLPYRLLSEGAVSVTVEFVRINFRRAGERLRCRVFARARARMTHSAPLEST